MISKLPDSLISQMLLYLPTKEAIKTSVLSKRWKCVWLSIPGLDLDANAFPSYNAFVSFMDRFIDFSREENSCLHKLKLSIQKDENDEYCVTRWVDFVATPKLKHLDVECLLVKRDYSEVMPISLYTCQTVLYLRLNRVWLDRFESVSLPCLKTMRLELNVYANETNLKSLISSCPVLQDLSIVRRVDDNVNVLRVHSQTLTSLSVGYDFGENGNELSRFDRVKSGILIDAPRLKYLNFKDDISKSKIINNLGSLAKVNFDSFFDIRYHSDGVGLSKNQMARNFFTCISRVRDLIISGDTMKDLTHSITPMAKISTSSVPQCLLSSLELVEMKSRFEGSSVEIEVVRYFLENSVVLKKLVVHLSSSMQKRCLGVLRDLLAFPRPSSMCQIVYVADC